MKKFKVVVNGKTFEVEVEELAATTNAVVTENLPNRETTKAQAAVPKKTNAQTAHGAIEVTAPLPGNINDIKVAVGDKVNAGDVLFILEAMKMENEILAPMAGKIKKVHVKKGQVVQSSDLLLVLA